VIRHIWQPQVSHPHIAWTSPKATQHSISYHRRGQAEYTADRR